ncbi:hypothetical protein CG717_18250 [Streptomyces sp. CB02613]|uniref:hypothetical protein n=1 Tax=Streptomyces sp. CB02613 TaxID=2020328 RepID=UPI000C27F526|nr:hypothetical protein [Streptomyces sp. CB02613]PJN30730.1 hypothetical protein CG717_18250 [Streptomyces sp. CB02613]
MDIFHVAQTASFAEFLVAYNPSRVNAEVRGRSVLMSALTNADPGARSAIATRLLDDGADATTSHGGVNALHALLGAAQLAPETEAPLLRRLLDGGADVNAVSKEYGTPLQLLMSQFVYSDEALSPLYDVLFTQADLDLLTEGAFGKSAYAMALKSGHRKTLRARMEQYLDHRGIKTPGVN